MSCFSQPVTRSTAFFISEPGTIRCSLGVMLPYHISVMPDDTNAICWDVYKTEEYRVVYGEGYLETYLWYDGRLCCRRDAALTYRDMAWEELELEALAAEQ